MIPRYNRPKIEAIWSNENKFSIWTEIECLIAEQLSNLGTIPKKAAEDIRKNAKFNVDEIHEIEKETKHDVIAYINNVSNYIGKSSKYFHHGVTSSDIIDTAFSIQLKQSSEIIIAQLKRLIAVLKKKSNDHKNSLMIGRSHGVHAEPITYGLKNALWKEEISRNIIRWKNALSNISVGQISGAVGTYQHLDPEIEIDVCKKLGLAAETVSSQVISRDRHAEYLVSLALIATTIEKISIEIRHLQRTEVLEVEEYFLKGQKGSSAMPHKRNPIVTERMTGFARLLRSNAMAALENVALWHERDISHSSVERIIIPDSTSLMDYMLGKMIFLMENLNVYPDNMIKNINITKGLVFSQEILLALVKKGITREDAYKIVQDNAMQVWKTKVNFKDLLCNNKDITGILSKDEIENLFDLNKIMVNINKIYKRLGY